MKKVFCTITALIILLNFAVLCVSAEVSGDYEYVVSNKGNVYIIRYTGSAEYLVIPDTIDGYPVTTIDFAAFSRNTSLTSITIPNSVNYIEEQAFAGCTSLASITIPGSVKNIGQYAFSCTSLTSVNLPEGIETIGLGAFAGCTSLTLISIPESVVKIGNSAFGDCTNLKNVIFNNPDTEIKEDVILGPGKFPVAGAAFEGSNNITAMYAFTGSQAQRYSLNNQLNFIPIARVQLNGQKLKFDVPPIIINGRVLVPVRKIFEELKTNVNWDDGTGTVTAANSDKSIKMQIGNPQMQVNGEKKTLDVSPQIILDRTLVPVRAVSESLGATVNWDDGSQTVIINTK